MSRGQRLTIHGKQHRPGGADPSLTGPWHKCGDPGEPTLGAGLTGRCWFKLVVGPTLHVLQSLEVMIAVSGGTNGTVVTTLPAGFFEWAEGENIPAPGFDSTGAFRPYYVEGTTGNIIIGPLP